MFSTEKEMISTLSVILGVIWFQGLIPKSAVKLLSLRKKAWGHEETVIEYWRTTKSFDEYELWVFLISGVRWMEDTHIYLPNLREKF